MAMALAITQEQGARLRFKNAAELLAVKK